MRILELTHYTAGSCGVGKRVLIESELLSKRGHTVKIFSSNKIKGSENTCKNTEKIGNVQINRFPAIKFGGEGFLRWNFESEAIKFDPEIIIAHSYRHIHTIKALNLSRKLNIPCLLVTHAPFERENTRTLSQNIIVWIYDLLIGRRTIKKFDKVLFIAPWEIDSLLKLGVHKEKIFYSPNGIKDEFFKNRKRNDSNSITYTGRIASVKNLEVLIKSMKMVDKKVTLLVRGPAEKNYLKRLFELVQKYNLENRIKIVNKEYVLSEQLKILSNTKIFVLPSKSEGMPQSLIEAMAMGKIVLGSDIKSIGSIIQDGKNCFLFKENDEMDLSNKINNIFSLNKYQIERIEKEAIDSVKRFKWSLIIGDLDKLIRQLKND